MFNLWQRRVGAIMILVLLLSCLIVPVVSANGTVVHVVKCGETLAKIACLYGVTVQQIQQWNNISNPYYIYAGEVLVINPPEGGASQVPVANVDAIKFGGKTADEWQAALDERYVRRGEPQTVAEQRYFKQVDSALPDGSFEPIVIEHKLGRYPVVEVYELQPLFAVEPPLPAGQPSSFQWDKVKFLVYTPGDSVAKSLRTESGDGFYRWGDLLIRWLDQVGVKPVDTESVGDLLNDFWGAMFDPAQGQDQFSNASFGHTSRVQSWIDDGRTVVDLKRWGEWDDILIAVRPKLTREATVFQVSRDAVEIRVPRAMDLMVVLR